MLFLIGHLFWFGLCTPVKYTTAVPVAEYAKLWYQTLFFFLKGDLCCCFPVSNCHLVYLPKAARMQKNTEIIKYVDKAKNTTQSGWC